MNATASSSEDPSARGLIAQAIHANQAHQYALTKYAERLTEELKEIDSLLKAADAEQHEDDAVEEDIQIVGAIAAKSPINAHDLLKSESPFYAEAKARSLYTSYTHSRPMKNRELDTLTDAVADEFRRLRAIDHRKRGLGIPNRFEPVDMNGDTKDVDWKIVAEKVSDVATFPRSAEECKVKWLGFKQPRLNHEEWGESEIKRLHEIVKDRQEQGKVDWVEVAQALGTNRVPIDCMRNAIPRPRHLWDTESDKRLVEAVKLYGQNNWSLCARYVSENTNASQCQGRYQRTINPHIRRDGWTIEEDEKIIAAVATYGPSWQEVASFVPGRTNDQCRERYQAALGSVPGRREGLWKPDEDEKLLEAVKIHGHKWKLVSAHMDYTRSVGQCRTHYVKLQKDLAGGSSSRGASAAPNASTPPAPDDATPPPPPSAPAPPPTPTPSAFSII
ncbi:hypothetical protein PM082_005207 [Marasmius tenuissimus]|nr:hypothetical protein PM082_005207 [Marasmius tenuissimus]